MKALKFIYTAVLAIVIFAGCNEKEDTPKQSTISFTVRYSEVSYDYAIINVKHNGPEDITWYGFLTENVEENDFKLYYSKYQELKKSGKITGLRKETDRNILLENLKENTEYKYIVFGLTPDGKMYDNVGIGSIEFKTSKNIYVLTQTDDWTFTYLGRNEDKTKEVIEVKANKGGRFGWQYVKKETIEQWAKEYPNGYELWVDDIYMNTLNGIEMFALQEISTIQYYITNGYELTDLTYIYEAGKPFEINRLSSGDYYLIAYGFQGDGQHTQTYSIQELTIEEEAADEAYTKWFGTYTFSGNVDVTQDNGEVIRENRTYNIKIEHYDNNFMYRLHGWECGKDVKYDWEEDIMQIDKSAGQFLAFPAYYRHKTGGLEIKESPMTYITFDGAQALILGIYGYAFNKEQNSEIPVILDNTSMAVAAPFKEGETTTELIGQKASYTAANSQKVEWEYCKMGYIAWSETTGAWQTINPPMRFPITITKVEDTSSTIETGAHATGGMKLFDNKSISTDFLKKDFKKLEKIQPEIFKTRL